MGHSILRKVMYACIRLYNICGVLLKLSNASVTPTGIHQYVPVYNRIFSERDFQTIQFNNHYIQYIYRKQKKTIE